jgi:hypothetical protein
MPLIGGIQPVVNPLYRLSGDQISILLRTIALIHNAAMGTITSRIAPDSAISATTLAYTVVDLGTAGIGTQINLFV